MLTKGLSGQTQKNLEILNQIAFVSRYYLAGGTALSLHIGHRFSFDLDFFSSQPEKPQIIHSKLMSKGNLEIFQNDQGTFNGQLNNVKLSFFIYPYSLLKPAKIYKKIKIASIEDIACMKIDAISSRGTKRDFIDLYFICINKFPLSKLLKLFEKKYAPTKFNPLHILKSLVYFEDARGDEMPRMIKKVDWNSIEEFFRQEVNKIITFM